jgi:hypothetical protein
LHLPELLLDIDRPSQSRDQVACTSKAQTN